MTPALDGHYRHDRDVRKLPFKDAPYWERDRRIGRNLSVAYALMGFTCLLLYGLVVWAVLS